MSHCTTCGAAVSETDKFCATCGHARSSRPQPLTVFYSYSHKDEELRGALETHLATLRRSGLISEWHDRKLLPGQDWDRQINQYLDSAQLILFLISADFIASSYIFDVEVKRAFERQTAGQTVIVPVILRPVMWAVLPDFGRLQALPDGARPVTEWPSPDLAFVSICEGILAIALARVPAAPIPPATKPRDIAELVRRVVRARQRVLDAALPARVPVGRPSALLVMVRRTDSPGLRAIVEAEPEYDIAAKDVASHAISLKFPVDAEGVPQPLNLTVKIESPQFVPPSQKKNLKISPRGDSEPRVFLLTPAESGSLLVNVEVYCGDEIVGGCVLRTVGDNSVHETETSAHPQTIVSASLTASDVDEPSGEDLGNLCLTGGGAYDPPSPPATSYSPPSPEISRDREKRALPTQNGAATMPPLPPRPGAQTSPSWGDAPQRVGSSVPAPPSPQPHSAAPSSPRRSAVLIPAVFVLLMVAVVVALFALRHC